METRAITKENEARVLKALGECQLFRALKPEQLGQLLKAAELVAYGPNETILKQGEPADSFLVITDGMAVVTADRGDGEVQLGQIPLPSSLGEVSLLLREPRTATVSTRGPVEALKFSAKAFEAMFKKIPEFGTAMAEGLAFRLQRLSDRVEIPVAVRPQPPAADVLNMLPMELIQRHRILPLKVEDNVLTLGMVDPPTTQVIRRRAGPPAVARGPAAAHRDRVLQRRARQARRAEGMGERQEEGGGRHRSRRPASGKLAEAPRARGGRGRVRPAPLRRPQAALAGGRRDEADGGHARPRRGGGATSSCGR